MTEDQQERLATHLAMFLFFLLMSALAAWPVIKFFAVLKFLVD